jgi:polysaccharide pyruvyl transferase WcaK-like protein
MEDKMENKLPRREWLKKFGTLTFGALLARHIQSCTFPSPKTLLVVSGWQDVNIGDIAHTPGLLHILETFLPESEIILWKRSNATKDVKQLLKNNFPNVRIIYGEVDKERNVSSNDVLEAFKQADILIHGSGPFVVGESNIEAWVKATGKPFGILGVTIQSVSDSLKELLQKASFIYTRETKSIEVLKREGIANANIAFAPDATFFMHIRDDEKAGAFMQEHGLEPKKFICAIPRLRYTPYHLMRKVDWPEEKIREVEETNQLYKEMDHAKMREAMVHWVRETGNKVLVCPEMTYQVDIMDELLIDPLPDDVRPFVTKRGYWMPDEAASVYRNAHTVLSFECHSPIIALHNGTPAFYLRQPEDTIKGQMYYDLGYDDWVFEIMETEGKDITGELMRVHADYQAAQRKVTKSNQHIKNLYKRGLKVVI